jgi:hypothetical protein
MEFELEPDEAFIKRMEEDEQAEEDFQLRISQSSFERIFELTGVYPF